MCAIDQIVDAVANFFHQCCHQITLAAQGLDAVQVHQNAGRPTLALHGKRRISLSQHRPRHCHLRPRQLSGLDQIHGRCGTGQPVGIERCIRAWEKFKPTLNRLLFEHLKHFCPGFVKRHGHAGDQARFSHRGRNRAIHRDAREQACGGVVELLHRRPHIQHWRGSDWQGLRTGGGLGLSGSICCPAGRWLRRQRQILCDVA